MAEFISGSATTRPIRASAVLTEEPNYVLNRSQGETRIIGR